MTTSIESVVLEVEDTSAAEAFYAALGVGDRVRVRAGDSPTSGFRGYALSVVVSQPAAADAYVAAATDAGADVVKAPAKSLWGYGGAFRAPDGAIWTVASSSKKDTAPAALEYDDLVLLLGVDDVKASKRFYAGRGLEVGKSYGKKYVEFQVAGLQLALQPRRACAKTAGVDHRGSGSHRIAVVSDLGSFTDPDGFVWTDPTADS